MQTYWLANNGRSSCLIFLSGWGMDPEPFRSIREDEFDLFMAYDYRQVEPSSVMNCLEGYDSLHLVAWSMGVWIAGTFFPDYRDRFETITAINGTLCPIDDQCGIPQKPFAEMISNFSPDVLEQFYHDMFEQPDQCNRFLRSRPVRSIESIGEELRSLHKQYGELGPGKDIFTRRIVGSRDRIFPARAQLRCWGKNSCNRIQAAHFPFYDWPSWDRIISGGMEHSCS